MKNKDKKQKAQTKSPLSAGEPKSELWDENYIEEFFKSIGAPIEDVSGKRDGTTSIMPINRAPKSK
jgi:hypothetical protein